MEKLISGVTIKIEKGDIAAQEDVKAVVNAANRELRPGGGVAGAIHRGAGPELDKECRKYSPISPGQSVISGAYELPNDYVIHCLGPVYNVDTPSDKLLAKCYKNALQLAEDHKISSIAFPAISTGAFGYPKEEAVTIALKTVINKVSELQRVNFVKFVLFDDESTKLHQLELERIV